jgi:hypothetical protein
MGVGHLGAAWPVETPHTLRFSTQEDTMPDEGARR